MSGLKFLVLLFVCRSLGIPQESRQKTTIFGDEKLQGEVFENLNDLVTFNDENNPTLYRLPNTTRPTHYNVLLHRTVPGRKAHTITSKNNKQSSETSKGLKRLGTVRHVDFNAQPQVFSGTVVISLVPTQIDVNEIVIHSEDLTINRVTLEQGATLIPTTFVEEPNFQFLRVRLNTGTLNYNPPIATMYTLSITFEAPLRDDMNGFYKSWFRNQHNDPISWMATTQFAATSARKAFPCYDEPSFKSVFDITIRRPAAYKSWSNTRVSTTVDSPDLIGYQDDIYYRTPIMSTYLLAFIVAEYESLAVYNDDEQLMYEVIARPNAIATNQGQYALEIGQELLAEMNKHTDYDYYSMNPNLKMTQASIPDFSFGAMENWGLLTYREAYVMYDEVHTNSNYKQFIASILAHEIAHMWFGNLVTCDWWDVVWLNEGYARYYQYFLTEKVEPDMGFETRFITEQVHTALLSDSANNPQPLTNPGVGSPAAVLAMFSTISYNKGAAVIRMTEHLLGQEAHKEGLRHYLLDNEFKMVLPMNLFESLQTAGDAAASFVEYGPDFSFVEYITSWTEQSGHPFLSVHVNHQTGDMTIHQHRFNINNGFSTINTNWIIPISFSSASNPDFTNTKPTHIIRKAVTIINRGSIGDEWVLFNKQQTGYYRVNYDDYTWDLITDALRGSDRTQIHEYNRAQIVNDVFQVARSGLMTYTKAFNILSFLEFETSYAPWVAAMTGFTWLRNRFATDRAYLDRLDDLIADWSAAVMADLTYYPTADPEDFMRSYLRMQLASFVCQLNRDTCRQAAVSQFTSLKANGQEVPADSRIWVYCNALREGTPDDFDFLRTRFIEHPVYTEKILLLQVLGCTSHATSLQQFLTDIVTPNDIVRPQDYTVAFSSAVNSNEENTQIVFAWIQANLAAVTAAFEGPITPLSYISARLRTEAEVDSFQQWATENTAVLSDAFTSVYNGAEATRQSIQWTANVTVDISNYFENDYQELVTSTPAPATNPDPPVTEQRPTLVEPQTPELTGSAVTLILSMSVLGFVTVLNFVL